MLGHYRVNARLARGGMSSIYLARDTHDGTLYALKVLRFDLGFDRSLRNRFLNESRAVQRIQHPAVVQIKDFGELDDGRVCLVMEYVDGSSLRALMKDGPVSIDKVVLLVGAVAEGLAAAHEQCVIHRDLKPENILLPRRSSERALAKIVDFGIARIIDAPRITTTHHVMGTPQYIAPEQAMGKPVDHRADIYALGVMTYEMLTGKLPFYDNDPDSLLRQHISTPPPPLGSQLPGAAIPDKLRVLVMRCLAKNPLNRPAYMEEILSVLPDVLG